MKKILILLIIWISGGLCYAQQLDISGDFRARSEYRNGYGTLKPDTAKAACFVVQRVRLNVDFSSKHLKMRVSPQNYHVWGDVTTTAKSDLGNAFHEAWAEIIAGPKISLRLGRQELAYDDHRILGNVDWAMQARSHDALLLKYMPDTSQRIHLGIAYNVNKESNFKENYLLPQYKALQFLWYHGNFKQFGVSGLLLNNGMPFVVSGKEKTVYSQTISTQLTYKFGKFNAAVTAALQTGKINNNSVQAHYYAAQLRYQNTSGFAAGLGGEYLSGKAQDDISTTVKSFNPLYGTNHKFNGYMDYFYVGNHINSVGLIDMYATLSYQKKQLRVQLQPHVFSAAAAIYQSGVKQDNLLGTEIDLTANYQLFDNVAIEGGIAKMLATSSMEILKGGNKDNGNYWAYLSVKCTPHLFSYKNENPKNDKL